MPCRALRVALCVRLRGHRRIRVDRRASCADIPTLRPAATARIVRVRCRRLGAAECEGRGNSTGECQNSNGTAQGKLLQRVQLTEYARNPGAEIPHSRQSSVATSQMSFWNTVRAIVESPANSGLRPVNRSDVLNSQSMSQLRTCFTSRAEQMCRRPARKRHGLKARGVAPKNYAKRLTKWVTSRACAAPLPLLT